MMFLHGGLLRRGLLGAPLVALVLFFGLPAAPAQVLDPCDPVSVPGLCDPVPEPTGVLPGPSPSPSSSPSPKPPKGKQAPAPGPGQQLPGQAVPTHQAPFAISGPNSSARVVEILSTLIAHGVSLDEALRGVMGPFPVAGPAWWINDWHAPRSGGRVHQGLDIFAPHGTPLVAAADGVLSQKGAGGLCGVYVEITDDTGVQYFYCHMSGWAPGITQGQRVRTGDLVGYVGNTGNAVNTPSHVHFEFQPGGVPNPPKPWVDRWVRMAEQRAIELVASYGEAVPPAGASPGEDFRLARLLDLTGGGGDPLTSDGELLLLAGLQPGASGLEMARGAMDRMAWEIDWSGRVDSQLAGLVADYQRYLVGQELAGLTSWPFAESDGHGAGTASRADGSD